MKCSVCGSEMILRINRKTGRTFYGCVGYPECRHTEQDNEQDARKVDPNPSKSGDPDEWPAQLRTDKEIARDAIRHVERVCIGDAKNVNERVIEAVHNWVTDNKSELLEDWDELRQKDWVVLLLLTGFESGRQFQRERPEEET